MRANNAILPYTGFTQRTESETGMERLWDQHLRKFASPDCIVYAPATWKSNTTRRLQQLERLGIRHVFLIGYSHGQACCIDIARRARQYGILTVQIDLLDAVARNRLLPRWTWAQALSARSLTPWASIRIPESVHRVTRTQQQTNRPRGHKLRWNPETTYVEAPLILPHTHSEIQWSTKWMDKVEAEIVCWLHPPKGSAAVPPPPKKTPHPEHPPP
jgi:hypothetical protein